MTSCQHRALPFSVAVRGGGLLFLSGQVAQDPATGELVDGDIAQQAEQILRNIAATLAAIGKDNAVRMVTTPRLGHERGRRALMSSHHDSAGGSAKKASLLTACSRQDDTRGHGRTPDDTGRHVEPGSVRSASNLRILWPRGRGSSSLPSRTPSDLQLFASVWLD